MVLYSPTGWTDESRDFVLGKGTLAFHDRRVSGLLFEPRSARFLMNETDEKLPPLKEAFSMDLDDIAFAKARQFIQEYFELNNSLALDTLVRELKISCKAGIRVFKLLSASEDYGLDTMEGVGMVLVRKY